MLVPVLALLLNRALIQKTHIGSFPNAALKLQGAIVRFPNGTLKLLDAFVRLDNATLKTPICPCPFGQ
jgi:hypothetical protein